MQISRNAVVEGIASSDKLRPSMQHVYLDASNQRIISTNGNALAVVPVLTDMDDSNGFISAEAFKAARKAAVRSGAAEIRANGKLEIPATGQTFPRPTAEECGQFPAVGQVINAAKAFSPVFEVTIDAALLLELAEALAARDDRNKAARPVKLSFETANKAIRVAVPNSDALGIIMPMRDISEYR